MTFFPGKTRPPIVGIVRRRQAHNSDVVLSNHEAIIVSNAVESVEWIQLL